MIPMGHTLHDALLAYMHAIEDGERAASAAMMVATRRAQAPYDELPELEDLWPTADVLIAPR